MNYSLTLLVRGLVAIGIISGLSSLLIGADGVRVEMEGELRTWHAVTLSLEGPQASEKDTSPNPFTDHAMHVVFSHESGVPVYTVPGYFAADGDAANTSATSGDIWRAHLSPDKEGKWSYEIQFRSGKDAAIDPAAGEILKPYHGKRGSFTVSKTNKKGRDFRSKGRL